MKCAFAIATSILLASLPFTAKAQLISSGGMLIDKRLKSADPLAVLRCDTHGACQSPLLISKGGKEKNQQDQEVWNANGCSVYWPYNKILVGKGYKPTLRWVLVKDPSDRNIYFFHPSAGINLTSEDPTKLNDRRFDLDREQREPDGLAFTWQNLHNVKTAGANRSVAFVPVVFRQEPEGRPPKKCSAADPDVVNEN